MVTLRHTPGLHVPYDQSRVGSASRRSTHNGETVTAQLTINGLIVGMIENDGNGGLTELYSPTHLFGWQRMHAYPPPNCSASSTPSPGTPAPCGRCTRPNRTNRLRS